MPSRLPEQNPNPVLRVDATGRLAYVNPAGQPLRRILQPAEDAAISAHLLDQLRAAADAAGGGAVDVNDAGRTIELRPVHDPDEPGALNVYGTDVTAARAVEQFPDSNPNPVLRLSRNGTLVYANAASAMLVAGLGGVKGEHLPDDLADRILAACATGDTLEIEAANHAYELKPVFIPAFDFINVYGTDISARRAMTKFPDQNPNPVLRFTPAGQLLYANPAADLLRRGLETEVGGPVPAWIWDRVQEVLAMPVPEPLEVVSDGRTYEFLVVNIPEFDFINAYGTDVTAARVVEQAHRENERLLLNILPAPVAARLRGGETVIADQFEEITVLFADIVDFTALAAQLSAAQVVGVLTDVFTACDELADRHGLEKIKTIGDAYMAVGGIHPGEEHAPRRVAEMALDMLGAIRMYRAPGDRRLQVRIGLHVGPAVAGVIGIRKFFYDVWGDTVNTASRLEETADPGMIQVLEPTVVRLHDAFHFAPRGIVELKGKGRLESWFLTGRRAAGVAMGEGAEGEAAATAET